jgi:hypothetical protein
MIYTIFKSPEPWKLNNPIHFLKDNLEVALIFNELQLVIPKLTKANVQKSKCFNNNANNLPFKQHDLSAPLSKARKNNFSSIDADFQLFIKELERLVQKELKKRKKKDLEKSQSSSQSSSQSPS